MSTDHPQHVLAGLSRRGFPLSPWPWRSLAYVATTGPVAGCVACGLSALAMPWVVVARTVADGRPLTAMAVFLVVVGAAVAAVLGPPLSVGRAHWSPRPQPGARWRMPSFLAPSLRWHTACSLC